MNNEYSDLLKDHLKLRPIAYYPIYKLMTGNFNGGIMLSQLMYWFRKKSKIYKTREELMQELCFSEREYRTGRAAISKLPFIKMSRNGSRGKNHYTIDRQAFTKYTISFIKENPIVAELFYDELKNNNDFKAFYTDENFGYTGKRPAKDDANDSLSDANDSLSDANVKTEVVSDANVKTEVNLTVANDSLSDANVKTETEKNLDTKKSCIDVSDSLDDANVKFCIDVSDSSSDANVTSLTENKTTNIDYKDYIVVGRNDIENEKSLKKKPSASSSHSSSEDKPQRDERISKYTPEFEFAWKLYKVDSSMKGSKKRASKEFGKTLNFYKDKELIYAAIIKYKDSNSFDLRPAQAASFFSGIRNPEHKYYKDYVRGGYEERLEIIKAKEAIRMKDNLSSQEVYRKDLSKQGELNTQDLMDRTSKLNLILNEKYNVDIGIFRFGNRKDWIKFTGPDYIAIPIKHPRSKTDKIKVLFHINELRQNLYVHLHGFVWNEELEKKYNDSNKGFTDIPSIEAPTKEELEQ